MKSVLKIVGLVFVLLVTSNEDSPSWLADPSLGRLRRSFVT